MGKSDYILKDDESMPVVGWIGPPAAAIRRDVMSTMVGAGFNISLAQLEPEQMLPCLDAAAEGGMRLLVRSPAFDLGRMGPERGLGYTLSEEQRRGVREAVETVRGHPALYGYYIHDEPAHADYDWIAGVIREIEALDSYHMCYVNHNAPVIQGGYGAGTQEALWLSWIEKTAPRFLSYDHYPIELKPREFTRALGPDAPNVFPGGIVVKPDYFWCLDMASRFCMALGVPLWAFTCSVPHWSYPVPTEGHIRFQLMCDLAYGARGLQYFTYWGANAIAGPDGPTPTWEIARKVNAEVQAMWTKLRCLRFIGARHTGPLWMGTRPPMLSPMDQWGGTHLGPKFQCLGDPAVLGLFDDPEGTMYVLAVNRNPVESASISLDPSLNDAVPHKWHPLRPGEGKLFKLREDKPPVAV
jgi:hypothetical protein